MDDDGNVTLMVSKFDDTTGTVSFETTHFSYYMVGGDPVEIVEESGSDDNTFLFAGIAAAIVAVIVVAAVTIVRRN